MIVFLNYLIFYMQYVSNEYILLNVLVVCSYIEICIFQGDVWVEIIVFGFLWYYFVCMEGKIYDIIEWVLCKVSDLEN